MAQGVISLLERPFEKKMMATMFHDHDANELIYQSITEPTRSSKRRRLDHITLSIVMPVYNEAVVLETLAEQVTIALRATGAKYEIVFVNDGSRDQSPAILDRLASRYSHIRVVHFSRNFGHQAAVHAGLAHARGEAVILMDSDMQDDPQAIREFLLAWQAGFDVVYAIRTDRKEAWWKRALFNGFHKMLSSVATTRIPADAGNFSLMDRRVVNQILELSERDRYLPGLRSWVGFKQTGIPVERLARYDDMPRVSLRGLWRLAKTAIFSFSSLPLTMFYGTGYAALALCFALTCFTLYSRLFAGTAIPGWTSHLLTASFFGALNALGISMLGEYAVRIYDQVRGRPLYLVDRTRNFETADQIARAAEARPIIENDLECEALLAESEVLAAQVTNPVTRGADEEAEECEIIPFACER